MCDNPHLVVTYPAPAGAALSDQYALTVNGRHVDVYLAPVWEPSYVKPFGGPYAFAYFDFRGTVPIEVNTAKPLDRLRVQPAARGIQPRIPGDTLRFEIVKPGQFAVQTGRRLAAAARGPDGYARMIITKCQGDCS